MRVKEVRAHEIADWIDCRRYGAFQQGLVPGIQKAELDNPGIQAGIAIHSILEWLHSLPPVERTERGLLQTATEVCQLLDNETEDHVQSLLGSFFHAFGLDPEWFPDQLEYEMSFKTPGGVWITGHLDEWTPGRNGGESTRIGEVKSTLSNRQWIQDRVYISAQPYIYTWLAWQTAHIVPEVVFTHISKELTQRHFRLMAKRDVEEWNRYLTYLVDYDMQHSPLIPNYRYWHCPGRCDQFDACRRMTLGGEKGTGQLMSSEDFKALKEREE